MKLEVRVKTENSKELLSLIEASDNEVKPTAFAVCKVVRNNVIPIVSYKKLYPAVRDKNKRLRKENSRKNN